MCIRDRYQRRVHGKPLKKIDDTNWLQVGSAFKFKQRMQFRENQHLRGPFSSAAKDLYANRGAFANCRSPLSSGYYPSSSRLSPAERRFEEDLERVKQTIDEQERKELIRSTLPRAASPLHIDAVSYTHLTLPTSDLV
eukprot:TRINITY_DN18207_c0_g1_i1.p1 TRINITY_DN18207_c0_g1~~TRINITY_DN18207_c0_g1_i1.p1  ORF type:complete len:138 (-),score=27.13 TRINITY_DN18207_c0_g1_i1:37-450(-)